MSFRLLHFAHYWVAFAMLGTAALMTGCGDAQVERLRADLQSRNPVIRDEAIMRIGQVGDLHAVPDLLSLMQDEHLPETRVLAARALGSLGASEAVPALVHALDAPEEELRVAAIEALGKIGFPAAVEPLMKRLNADGERLVACWALGHIGDPQAIGALVKLLDDEDAHVRFNARQALKRIDGER